MKISMELKKVWDGGTCESPVREIHEGWYKQRLRFNMFVYADGTEKVTIFDYSQNKELCDIDLTKHEK